MADFPDEAVEPDLSKTGVERRGIAEACNMRSCRDPETRGVHKALGMEWLHPAVAVQDDDEQMRLQVVCRSGRKEDERPIRFQLGDHEYFVEEVVDQWYGPDDTFFKVRTSDDNVYVLRRHSSTPEGEWSLESFRDYTAGK